MDILLPLAKVAAVWFLFVVSPGPNFVIVSRQAMTVSRRSGACAALGVSIGAGLWASAAIGGLGFVIAEMAWLYGILKWIGAAYLVYLGVRLLWQARQGGASPAPVVDSNNASGWRAVRLGLISSLTNPKTAAFFGSLFLVVLPAQAPFVLHAATVAVIFAISAAWYSGVAGFFALPPVRAVYGRLRIVADVLMGGLLVFLGVRLALARS
jgi:threonine/homoserine/homoserine lactone efflux protein